MTVSDLTNGYMMLPVWGDSTASLFFSLAYGCGLPTLCPWVEEIRGPSGIETISNIARGGSVDTFAWIIVRPSGKIEQGILGKKGPNLPSVIEGAARIQEVLAEWHQEDLTSAQLPGRQPETRRVEGE